MIVQLIPWIGTEVINSSSFFL